ncbi:putative porin [Blastochloris viridis]|nr:putative porin [Blastochloris viridis]
MSVLAVAIGALVAAAPAVAQDGSAAPKRPEVSNARPTSPSVTVNLVNALVKQGVLTEEQAQALIKQAEDEAYVARQAAKDANTKADEAAKTATAAAAAASPPGTKRVTYVPEVVKKQLREDLRREVMQQARAEGWASPGKYPEWASRIRFYGDLRTRYEGQFFPDGGYNGYDFNAVNIGSAYDIFSVGNPWISTYNGTEDRERFRLRARLGLDADLNEDFSAGMRIATGDSNSPVSTNQTLGGSGGNFSKYSLWLDRAYLRYQPVQEIAVSAGRFDNPFWTAGDMVWNKDLGFDGAALKAKGEIAPGLAAFLSAGVFPIFNTSLNAGLDYESNATGTDSVKVKSNDKWLQGGQIGLSTILADHWSFTLAGAFYNFSGVQGKLSSPCDTSNAKMTCDTDLYRPSFAQKGNTYMALRDPDPSLISPASQYQYFGLASEFRPVVVSARLDLSHFDPVHVLFDGEFVKNTAFDRAAVAGVAVNNFGPDVYNSSGTKIADGGYEGGDTGWFGRVTVGHPEIKQLWDWSVHAGYKYVESDATVDAFTDSDFGLGGTNLKGYFIGASLGLADNISASMRWLSANSIADYPYAVDVLQIDLNAKF